MYSAEEAIKKMCLSVLYNDHIKAFGALVEKCIEEQKTEFIFDVYLTHIEELYLKRLGYHLEWNTVTCWYDVKMC